MVRRPLLVLLVCALIGALVGLFLGPRPIPLGAPSGDPGLAAEAAAALGSAGHDGVVSVVRIRDGQATWAGFGEVTADSRFEIGSLTKTFDGLLLAEAVSRGEVTLDARLDSLLPELAGAEAGSVTLSELATHTSGLPAMGDLDMLRLVVEDLAGASYSVYRLATPESLMADAGRATLSGRGSWRYSNLGASLLGVALVRAAHAPDWPSLVTERLFGPLGMTQTRVAAPGHPEPDLLPAHNPNGRPIGPLTSTGYAPAGIGVTSTAADLTRYAQALLDGTAPGLEALSPRIDITSGMLAGQQMGLAWMISGTEGGQAAWHNGMSGGMASMFALDRDRGAATIVLTDRARDVTGAGLTLLADGEDPGLPPIPHVDTDTVPWVALGVVTILGFAWTAVRARGRVRLLGAGLAAVGALLLWGIAQPWDWVPGWAFGLAAGLTLGAAVVTGRRWSDLPWLAKRWRPGTLIVGVLGVAVFLALIGIAGWVLALSSASGI